jgi:REP element-mobilizing transposase RayT
VCAELPTGLEACEFGPDHMLVFVSRCKNNSVPEIVWRLKGASSRRIRLDSKLGGIRYTSRCTWTTRSICFPALVILNSIKNMAFRT